MEVGSGVEGRKVSGRRVVRLEDFRETLKVGGQAPGPAACSLQLVGETAF